MIDIHCHLFNFESIPEGFFRNFFIKRDQLVRVIKLLYKLLPWTKENISSQYASLLKVGSYSSSEIFKRMLDFYPENAKFVPLMIDYRFAIKGRIPKPYETQRDELMKLKALHPEKLFPFLAVDPRRPDIQKTVEEFVGKQKPFRGIKIYPALGYLPSHPVLMEIYDYCEKNRIPITTHTSSGAPHIGRHDFNIEGLYYKNGRLKNINKAGRFLTYGQACRFFGEPIKWLPVLEKYPDLYLNLAHFGGEKEFMKYIKNKSPNWTDQIINMMMKYKNVYSDISFIIYHKPIYPVLKKLLSSSVGDKILFGTDNYLVLIQGFFNKILNHCYVEFSKEEFQRVSLNNNSRFLGLPLTQT